MHRLIQLVRGGILQFFIELSESFGNRRIQHDIGPVSYTHLDVYKRQSDETVTVTVWTNNYHDKSFVMEKVNEWNSTVGKDKKIRIDYQVKDDIEKVLEVALISGQGPDMFPILGGSLEKYATEGWIEAIEDLPGGRELIGRFDGMLSYNKHIYDGKTYILPNSSTTYGLVYNKDMFAAAGPVSYTHLAGFEIGLDGGLTVDPAPAPEGWYEVKGFPYRDQPVELWIDQERMKISVDHEVIYEGEIKKTVIQ